MFTSDYSDSNINNSVSLNLLNRPAKCILYLERTTPIKISMTITINVILKYFANGSSSSSASQPHLVGYLLRGRVCRFLQ